MVHALERVERSLASDGAVVLIQPHQRKRPSIAITSGRGREAIATMISPDFQPMIDAANAAIRTVTDDGRFRMTSEVHRQFRVRLRSLAELRRYLDLGQKPPRRFPAGARRTLDERWRSRPPDAQIEVTEHFTVMVMRPASH